MATPETVPVVESPERPADGTLAEVIPLFPDARAETLDSAQRLATLVALRNSGAITYAAYAEGRNAIASPQSAERRTAAATHEWLKAKYELSQIHWED